MATSNALWGYLLRNDPPEQESVSKIPPLAPLDKTGTSIRMLVHDTQANLEKFSGRVDALLTRVDDCKSQVVSATGLLEAERDQVLAEVLDIANKCQSELKSHVGTPAQAHALEVLQISQISTERSVQALDKRIDALQGMFQAHTNVLKSIQDQQNAILDGILPIFTLVQSVPQQINELNMNLTNTMSNTVSNLTSSLDDIKTTFKSMYAQQTHSIQSATASGSRSSSKRTGSAIQDPSDIAERVDTFPLTDFDRGTRFRSSKRLRSAAPPQPSPHLTQSPGPQASDVRAPILHRSPSHVSPPPGTCPSPAMQKTLGTAKRPFTGPIPPCELSNVEMLGSSLQEEHPRNFPLSESTCPKGPPASTSPGLATNGRPSDAIAQSSSTGNSILNPIVLESPGSPTATSKNAKIEDNAPQNLSGIYSITSSPLSSVPSQPQSHPPSIVQSGVSAPESRAPPQSRGQNHRAEIPSHFAAISQLSNFPVSSNPCTSTSPPKPMSLRDRRAQMSVLGRTRTRRIIPLLPSSDEEF